MRKTSLAVIVMCVALVCLGEAHAARFETHATNPTVPKGTVYDTKTNLLWEMKTEDRGVHDVSNLYTWSSTLPAPDGSAFMQFLWILNNGLSTNGAADTPITGCFANRCDWRLPSIVELRGIVDLSAPGCRSGSPCIDPAFGPTQRFTYKSATTYTGYQGNAWSLGFGNGSVYDGSKLLTGYVRAVRSGL